MEIRQLINEITESLPRDLQSPTEFNMVYAKNAEYRPVYHQRRADSSIVEYEKVLFAGAGSEMIPITAHEFGHLILDEYLRQNSEFWQYYIIGILEADTNLNKAAQETRDHLRIVQKSLVEYKAKFPRRDDLHRQVEKSINQYKKRLHRLELALDYQEKFGDLDTKKDSIEFLQPYFELFADYLAAIYTQDWQVMAQATEHLYFEALHGATNAFYVVLPDSTTIEQFSLHRGFQFDFDTDSYNFKDWEKESVYTQFLPTRAFLAENTDIDSKSGLLLELAQAILQIYEREVPKQNESLFNLKEKNSDLIAVIQRFQNGL